MEDLLGWPGRNDAICVFIHKKYRTNYSPVECSLCISSEYPSVRWAKLNAALFSCWTSSFLEIRTVSLKRSSWTLLHAPMGPMFVSALLYTCDIVPETAPHVRPTRYLYGLNHIKYLFNPNLLVDIPLACRKPSDTSFSRACSNHPGREPVHRL